MVEIDMGLMTKRSHLAMILIAILIGLAFAVIWFGPVLAVSARAGSRSVIDAISRLLMTSTVIWSEPDGSPLRSCFRS